MHDKETIFKTKKRWLPESLSLWLFISVSGPSQTWEYDFPIKRAYAKFNSAEQTLTFHMSMNMQRSKHGVLSERWGEWGGWAVWPGGIAFYSPILNNNGGFHKACWGQALSASPGSPASIYLCRLLTWLLLLLTGEEVLPECVSSVLWSQCC